MPIPTIAPYPMPTAADVPESVVDWQPDASRAALLIHDLQRYFLDFFRQDREPVVEMLRNVRVLLDVARQLNVPVYYTAQPGGMTRRQRGLLMDVWGPGMSTDPEHREIADAVAPDPSDTIVPKWRYSAFHGNAFGGMLARRDRDQLIVCGLYAHIGCLITAADAFARDIEAFLVADAMADFSEEEHRLAVDYAARRCARPLMTADVVEFLRSSLIRSG